jgi:hypothetical protein
MSDNLDIPEFLRRGPNNELPEWMRRPSALKGHTAGRERAYRRRIRFQPQDRAQPQGPLARLLRALTASGEIDPVTQEGYWIRKDARMLKASGLAVWGMWYGASRQFASGSLSEAGYRPPRMPFTQPRAPRCRRCQCLALP